MKKTRLTLLTCRKDCGCKSNDKCVFNPKVRLKEGSELNKIKSMKNSLREKFEKILDKHNFGSSDEVIKTHISFMIGSLEDAYYLGKSESEATIESLSSRIVELQAVLKEIVNNPKVFYNIKKIAKNALTPQP